MATANQDPSDKSTLYNTCKEKAKSFVEEWSNNFKMCYCPCKINKYDMMDSDDEKPPVQRTIGDDEEDTHNIEVSTSGEPTQPTSSKHFRPPTPEQAIVAVENTGPPTPEQATVTIQNPPTVEEATVTVETTRPPTLEQLQGLNIEPIHFKMLGFYLQLGQDKLNEIGRSLDSTSDALAETYRVWLERGVNVTWECMVQALEDCQLMDKAQNVRSEYLQ